MLLAGKSIFIVEDNLQNRLVFQMALVRHGAVVEFERWGRNTLASLTIQGQKQFDVICLDLMLAHDVSGFDVFSQIRALPAFDQVPIVAVSAMDAAIAVPKARALGFSGFITKPINSNLFPKQLAKVMAGEKIWHSGVEGIRS
jgi:CheY-like chemotaxis protein